MEGLHESKDGDKNMPILLKMNLSCNFRCEYCYEEPIKPDEMQEIDYDAVEKTVRELWKKGGGEGKDGKPKLDKNGKYCGPGITVHGGEPTILPLDVLERFLKLSFELTGKSGIQTNGYLITEQMIELFKKYDTGVGFSIDGPWPLNELRGIGKKSQRKQQTKRIIKNLYRLRETKLPKRFWHKGKDGKLKEKFIRVSVIVVVHKKNAVGDRREMLKQWITELNGRKIGGRLNPCCSDDPEIALTIPEAVEAYTDLCDFMFEMGYSQWSPFKDITNSLQGKAEVVCKFRDCDPYCTNSATTILKDGSVGVCLRLYNDGKTYLRAEKTSSIRSEALRQTDCKDCKWWEHCYGGCSGMSLDGDWRNKDRYCDMYKALFEKTSNVMKALRVSKTVKPKEFKPSSPGNYTDGTTHLDDGWRHEDSDPF